MAGNWHRIGDIKGRDGVGVPTGGARGDVLKKEGGTDYATSWGAVNYEDIQGKVPASALPEIGTAPYVVDSQAAMLNLPAVPGRQAIRTDIGATFVLAQEPASALENWIEMVSRSDVTSVNSKTGSVVLTKADVGLSEVNNTADTDKPVATGSVRGLMSSADKTKLDKATPSPTGGTFVRRDGSGSAVFSSVGISNAPSSSAHAATKGYVDLELEGKLDTATTLSQEDLNTVTKEGLYRKVGTADIGNPDLHYPPGSSGAGVLLVTLYSTTGIIHEWTTWGGGVTTQVRKWIRNSNDKGQTWTDWREMAGKELATPSRDGLMPHTDKALLDGATYSGTPNALVKRNSDGRVAVNSVAINRDPSGPSDATRKSYVDGADSALGARIDNSFLGRGRIDGESWNDIRTTVSAVVDDDAPTGSPTYARVSANDNLIPFGLNKVWLLDVTDLGLGYVRQRAQILQAVPAYLVGFAWERVWSPADGAWSDWTTVSGTTGPLPVAQPIDPDSQSPLALSTNVVPYSGGVPMMITRTLDTVYIRGQLTPRTDSFAEGLKGYNGILLMYLFSSTDLDIPTYFFAPPSARASSSVQQGSHRANWYLRGDRSEGFGMATRWRGMRHQATGALKAGTWLPITVSYNVVTPSVVGTADPDDPENETPGGDDE